MIPKGELHKKFEAEEAFFGLFEDLRRTGYFPILNEEWIDDKSSGVAKLYKNLGEYIVVQDNQKRGLHLKMLSMPNNGVPAMIQVLRFSLEKNLQYIYCSAQPQKTFSQSLDRRARVLMNFYGTFGFRRNNLSTGDMRCDLTNETLMAITQSMRKDSTPFLPNNFLALSHPRVRRYP